MIHTIENEIIKVSINDIGAELFSIIGKKTNTEYLWQGDETYWKSRAPILFPVCGRIWGGKYVYNNAEYEMIIHGFARHCEYSVKEKGNDFIVFVLEDSAESLTKYPFKFKLTVSYKLNGGKIDIKYNVFNKDEKLMYYSIGSHPGFNVPFNKNEKFTDYYLEFDKEKITKRIYSDTCYFTEKVADLPLENKKLNLVHDLFVNDAIFLILNDGKIQLKSKTCKQYLEIGFSNMTCVGLWQKPHTEAPYVCIEPWHGVPSDDGKQDNLVTKRQIMTLKPSDNCSFDSYIKIVE